MDRQPYMAAFVEREVKDDARWEFVGWFKVEAVAVLGPAAPGQRHVLMNRALSFPGITNNALDSIPKVDVTKRFAVIKFAKKEGEGVPKPPEIKGGKKLETSLWKRNAPPPLQLQQSLTEREDKSLQKGAESRWPTTGYRPTRPGSQAGGSSTEENLPSPLEISDWRKPTKSAHTRHYDWVGGPPNPAQQPQPKSRVEFRPEARQQTPSQPRLVFRPEARQGDVHPDAAQRLRPASSAGLMRETSVTPSSQGSLSRQRLPAPNALLPIRQPINPPSLQEQMTTFIGRRRQPRAESQSQRRQAPMPMPMPMPTSMPLPTSMRVPTPLPTLYEAEPLQTYPQYVDPRDVMNTSQAPLVMQAPNDPAPYPQYTGARNVQHFNPWMGSVNPDGPSHPDGWIMD
ncbi:hypothetical protein F5B19DRAFT_275343 [Rostrohypoxylon terebratum]|nr:hypothetical protein F5B19DRAFT_275343 [Rostrohypoxylon terebratum]